MSESLLNVAVIGKGNQAARHIQILRSTPGVRLAAVLYHKQANDPSLPLSTTLSDLSSADAIIVSSPTPTHADYLRRLEDYRGYVLVEKPAVSTVAQAQILRRWSSARKKRVRINFNLLHSEFFESFHQAVQRADMGRLLAFDVHTSHGLAFRPSYADSWRNAPGQSGGVLETVGIHFVNLVLNVFGVPSSARADLVWASIDPHRQTLGRPADTAVLHLKMESGLIVTLRHSYAAPLRNHWLLLGTNGIWEYDGHSARTRGPRDTLDSSGRFVAPPVLKDETIEFAPSWHDSVTRAVQRFLDVVRSRGSFSPEEFDRGLASMDIIAGVMADCGP